ncbi:MAG: adenylate/guanylate cyclase domain-containing protein [Inquilinaceae bacterium]
MRAAAGMAAEPASHAAAPSARRTRRVSISVTLAMAIGGLVFIAVASILIIAYIANRDSTIALLRDRAELTVQAVENRLTAELGPPLAQIEFLAGLIEAGSADPADPESMALLLSGGLSATPQVAALLFWTPEALAVGVARLAPGDGAFIRDDAGDPQIAGILAEAATRRDTYWGEIVFGEDRNRPILNLRRPVYRDDRFAGLLVAAVFVDTLSRSMTDPRDEFDRNVFVLRGYDRVLAHFNLIDGTVWERLTDGGLPGLDEVGDPVLAAMWSGGGDENALAAELAREIGGHSVEVNALPHIFLYAQVQGFGEPPLIVGSHVRARTMLGVVRDLALWGLTGVAVLVVSLVLAVILGRWIARPIRRVATQALALSRLEFETVSPLPGSPITELDDQAMAFNRMLGGLRWFETYVPRTLVRRLVAKEEYEQVRSIERQLTVMFTDIAGFTGAAESLPAAETAAFLNDHFASVGGCVDAEGGTIDKFIGDGLMAFWNAPDKQADHAERACRAALAIADAVDRDNAALRDAGRPAVGLRIGIHTGAVVVGNIGAPGRMNYTIVGDPVNTCSRLEELGHDLAVPGRATTILISADTAALLGPGFTLVSCGRHVMRGRQEPVEVFRLE